MSHFTGSVTSGPPSITIAVDAMGGDFGPEIVIPGLAIIHEENREIRFIIFGDESRINPHLSKFESLKNASRVVHTDKMVRSNEKPSSALRASKGTSMRMAIEAVHEGQAHAIVSAGNTGALMAMAKVVLRMLPGIHRPALCSVFPALEGTTVMLDLGANVLVDAETLTQFAVMHFQFVPYRVENIPLRIFLECDQEISSQYNRYLFCFDTVVLFIVVKHVKKAIENAFDFIHFGALVYT